VRDNIDETDGRHADGRVTPPSMRQVVVTADRCIWHPLGQGRSRRLVSQSGERIDSKQPVCSRNPEAVAEGDLAKVAAVRSEDVIAHASADVATVAGPQVAAIVEIAEVLTAPSPQVRHGAAPCSQDTPIPPERE
jgi:hypothetical protein